MRARILTQAPRPDPTMAAAVRTRSDTSTTRVLGVLDLFTVENPVWTADMLVDRLGLARATIYRYVRALADAGFLVPVARGGYVLGPRFVEIDRQIRLADPLLRVTPPVMADLRELVGGAQLLCGFYANRVLTILQDRTDDKIKMSMERGRPFPLFLGAPSRIILAHLPGYQLRNLILNFPREVASAGLGDSWPEFRDRLRAIRKTGYYVGSEIDASLVGVSAPIFRAEGAIIASICMVRRRSIVKEKDIAVMADLARTAGTRISAGIQAFWPQSDGLAHATFPIARL